VEGKTLPKGEDKKDLSLEKLEEVEKAYSDLMKAYSSCLITLDRMNKIAVGANLLKKIYSISWDKVPGEDSERLRRFLMDYLDISWVENVEINKSVDGKTIYIFSDENSAEITIDEKKGQATLNINDGRTLNLNIKKKHGKLNIYPKLKQMAWLDIHEEFNIKEFQKRHIIYMRPKKIFKYTIRYRIARLRIRKGVDLLRDAFLLLLTQNRIKNNSEFTKKIEIYCEDLGKLSAQFTKYSSIFLFYALIPVVPVLIIGLGSNLANASSFIFESIVIIYLIAHVVLFLLVFVYSSYWISKRLLSKEKVSEKEKKIFALIQEYLEFE
jgi:hypothetical protein